VSCREGGKLLWEDLLRPCVTAIAGNSLLSAVGCEDGSLFLYTPAGRRVPHLSFSITKKYNPTETSSYLILQMLPCIYLGSGVVHLEANANRHLAAITSDCSIHIWYTAPSCPSPPSLFFNALFPSCNLHLFLFTFPGMLSKWSLSCKAA